MTAAFTGLRLGAARARRGLRIENRSSSRRRPPLF